MGSPSGQHPAFVAAFAPIDADVRRSCGIELMVDDPGWLEDPNFASAMVGGADGASGVAVDLRSSAAERVADVADQVQEVVIEQLWRDGRSTSWPECPRHPNSHPLASAVVDRRAVWECSILHDVIAQVGALVAET